MRSASQAKNVHFILNYFPSCVRSARFFEDPDEVAVRTTRGGAGVTTAGTVRRGCMAVDPQRTGTSTWASGLSEFRPGKQVTTKAAPEPSDHALHRCRRRPTANGRPSAPTASSASGPTAPTSARRTDESADRGEFAVALRDLDAFGILFDDHCSLRFRTARTTLMTIPPRKRRKRRRTHYRGPERQLRRKAMPALWMVDSAIMARLWDRPGTVYVHSQRRNRGG